MQPPSGPPTAAPARSTVRYVPLSRARPPDILRPDSTSDRILKYVLLAGTLLLVVLFGVSMADSFIGGAAFPSAPTPTSTPVVTSTPVPTTAMPVMTDTPIPATAQTMLPGTLSPYSVDPNQVTPDPDATVYVAPGYRRTYGETAEPEATGAEIGSNGVYVTPSLPIVVTPLPGNTPASWPGPATVTSAPTTEQPAITTAETTHPAPATSATTTVKTAVPTTTKPAGANTTATGTTATTQSPTSAKTTVPLPPVETTITTAATTATAPPTVLPTTPATTAAGNVSV